MIITGSNITLASQHRAVETHEHQASLKVWVGDRRPDFEGKGMGQPSATAGDRVTISTPRQAGNPGTAAAGEAEGSTDPAADEQLEPRLQLLAKLIERLTGRKITVFDAKKMEREATAAATAADTTAASSRGAGYGIEYDLYETSYEQESTTFSASGVIKTADGQEISFDLALAMSREYYRETDISIRAGDAVKKDPLVINFAGTAAELSDVRFSFDLDADGTTEQIATLAPASGYLALDKNGDGSVTNGSELFGPTSGDGFAELAAYDDDGNGWIDENDAVFNRLQVWRGATAGTAGTLTGLKEAGVGAIYLGRQATPFDIKDPGTNSLLGSVKASGIFAGESGTVGTVQQLDLAV